MRRKCYWDKHGEQIAEPVSDPKRQRNVNADVVGKNKAREEKLAKRRKAKK